MYAVFITFYHYITHIPFPVFIFSAKEKDAFYETSCPLSIYLLPVTVFPRTFLPIGPKSCQEVYSPRISLYPSMLFSFSPLLPFSSFPPLPLPASPARSCFFHTASYGCRNFEILHGITAFRFVHIIAPDRRRNGAAGIPRIGGRVITDPDRRGEIRCISDKPCVMFIISSPRLARRRPSDIRISAGSAGDDFFQHARQCPCRGFINDLRTFRRAE